MGKLFLNGKLYVTMDCAGRIILPKDFYNHEEDMYLKHYVYAKDNIIYITFDRTRPPLNYAVRIYIPNKVRQIMKIDSKSLFECIKCKDGFMLKRTALTEVVA